MWIVVAEMSVTMHWVLQIDLVVLKEAPNLIEQLKGTKMVIESVQYRAFLRSLKALCFTSGGREYAPLRQVTLSSMPDS